MEKQIKNKIKTDFLSTYRFDHFLMFNQLCIPESFNTNISHQLLNHKITLVNSQRKYINSKSDFVHKNIIKISYCICIF